MHVISMHNNTCTTAFCFIFGQINHSTHDGEHTSVFVVVGRDEGPFSAPKALEAPMGELGPEPGALLVGVQSMKHQGVRQGVC